MKKVKRFEIEVPASFDDVEYNGENYPLKIEDLEIEYADAMQGDGIAEVVIFGNDENAAFQLNLDAVDALFEVLTHIKAKVLATKKVEETSIKKALEANKSV